MPRRKKVIIHKNYTSIAQAEDHALAEDCVRLLRDNQIEAKADEAKKNKILIKVEEGRFHEAYMLIQEHLTPEGFFDIYKETIQIKDPNQAA